MMMKAVLCLLGTTSLLLVDRSDATELDAFASNLKQALQGFDHTSTAGRESDRNLQAFATIEDCVTATGSAALCSCIFNDGLDLDYCQACGGALLASEFSLDDTSKFGDWFSDDSVLNLAQTGSYYGIAGITEYVNFIYSVFFSSYELVEDFGIKFIGNDNFASDGQCIVAIAAHRRAAVPSEFFDAQCYRTTAGTSIYYTPTTAENGYIDISRADVFYPPTFLKTFFGDMKEEAAINWLCDTVEAHCPETWTLNKFDGENEQRCYNSYKLLPRTQGLLAAIDGPSLGCKLLHATFVSLNNYHCAHTSFRRQRDPSDVLKCQRSERTQPRQLFSQTELQFFRQVGRDKFGFDVTLTDASQTQCN